MAFRSSLAAALFVLTTFVSLRADDFVAPFADEEANTLGLSTSQGEKLESAAAWATATAENLTGHIDPAGWFTEPGCCDNLDGVGCAACGPADGSGCGSCYRIRLVPYGWLMAVHGNATVRGLSAPIDLSARDVLEIVETDADFVFMGKLEIESDECGLIVNGLYFKAGFGDALPRINFNSTFDMAIVDIAGTYNILKDPESFSLPYISRFDLLAGIRYWLLDGSLAVTGPLGNTIGDSGEKEWVDPIIGGRIIVPICEGSEAQIRGDIGGFDWGSASQFTWNLEALMSLRCSECVSLRGGYRVLDVYHQQGNVNDRFALDCQFRGPVAEIAIEF